MTQEDRMDVVEHDAREFGLHVKQGGWRLGLLVARNVERGTGGRGRKGVSQPRNPAKISGAAFAIKSQTSADRVLRYLDAWDRAAAAGHVTSAVDLAPGDEPPLDVEALPPWTEFYESVTGGRPRDGKTEDAVTILERQTPEDRGRVVTRLLADPDTRSVVGQHPEGVAAVESMQSDIDRRREPLMTSAPLTPPPAFASKFWRAVTAMQDANAELERFGVKGLESTSDTRAAAERLADQAAHVRTAVVDYVVENIT
jgi:hypothetical protein